MFQSYSYREFESTTFNTIVHGRGVTWHKRSQRPFEAFFCELRGTGRFVTSLFQFYFHARQTSFYQEQFKKHQRFFTKKGIPEFQNFISGVSLHRELVLEKQQGTTLQAFKEVSKSRKLTTGFYFVRAGLLTPAHSHSLV